MSGALRHGNRSSAAAAAALEAESEAVDAEKISEANSFIASEPEVGSVSSNAECAASPIDEGRGTCESQASRNSLAMRASFLVTNIEGLNPGR